MNGILDISWELKPPSLTAFIRGWQHIYNSSCTIICIASLTSGYTAGSTAGNLHQPPSAFLKKINDLERVFYYFSPVTFAFTRFSTRHLGTFSPQPLRSKATVKKAGLVPLLPSRTGSTANCTARCKAGSQNRLSHFIG